MWASADQAGVPEVEYSRYLLLTSGSTFIGPTTFELSNVRRHSSTRNFLNMLDDTESVKTSRVCSNTKALEEIDLASSAGACHTQEDEAVSSFDLDTQIGLTRSIMAMRGRRCAVLTRCSAPLGKWDLAQRRLEIATEGVTTTFGCRALRRRSRGLQGACARPTAVLDSATEVQENPHAVPVDGTACNVG